MPVVWVPNKSGHDFSDAQRRFGELKFLSRGKVNILDINSHYITFVEQMKDARPDDYLLVSSAGALCVLAAAILVEKFGQINMLVFSDGKYIERNVDISALLEVD